MARVVAKMLAQAPEDSVERLDSRLQNQARDLRRSDSHLQTGALVGLGSATAILAHGALGAGHCTAIAGLAVASWAMLRMARSAERQATQVEISNRQLMAEAKRLSHPLTQRIMIN